MRERSNDYFGRARAEVDERYQETLIDIAIDFSKIAFDLEDWEQGKVAMIPASRYEQHRKWSDLGFVWSALHTISRFSVGLGGSREVSEEGSSSKSGWRGLG